MAQDSQVPAFPAYTTESEGMSLREWYAGLAMQGIVAATAGSGPRSASKTVNTAFEIADAMMAKIAEDSD